MNIKSFEPTNKRSFVVESGKLIVADPFQLGFPVSFIKKIHNIEYGRSKRGFPHKDILPYGFMITTEDDGGCWNVYRKGSEIQLVDSRVDPKGWFNHEKHRERLEDRKGWRIQTTLDEILEKEPELGALFGVSHNYYNLLVGDAEKYTLTQKKRIVPYSETAEDENFLTFRKKEMEKANSQIIDIPRGRYQGLVSKHTVFVRPI